MMIIARRLRVRPDHTHQVPPEQVSSWYQYRLTEGRPDGKAAPVLADATARSSGSLLQAPMKQMEGGGLGRVLLTGTSEAKFEGERARAWTVRT